MSRKGSSAATNPPPMQNESASTHVIAIANRKGGVGKTTCAWALSSLLAEQASTLVVDLTDQANLTECFGINPDTLPHTIADALLPGPPEPVALQDILQRIGPPPADLFLAPSSGALVRTEPFLHRFPGWESCLKSALSPLLPRFRFVVIDCATSLYSLLQNALVAATEVLVPLDASAFSVQGVVQMKEVFSQISAFNPGLQPFHAISCRTDGGRLEGEVRGLLEGMEGVAVCRTTIRRSEGLVEAQSAGKLLHRHRPDSLATKDYRQLIEERRWR